MSCRGWEERLALYAGGDLDGTARAEVERHLAECPECRAFAGGMGECLESMRLAHAGDLAPAHFTAVRARVLERLREAPHGTPAWRWIAAACAVLALALLVAVRAPRPARPDLPPPHVALAHPPAPPLIVRAPAARPARHAPVRHPEPLLVKIETDNPDVVIYWIAN